ncbi:MAG: hypothetical protein WBR15_02880 [Gammaproteobacteria bacterium]
MSQNREDWESERKLMKRWANWCLHADSRAVMHTCGLTWAGSPPAIMDEIYDRGAATADEATGYARESAPAPDYISPAIDNFMAALSIILPAAYAALIARHRRMVYGQLIRLRPEWWIAEQLYGLKRSQSHARLAADCITGYAAMRRWLIAEKAKAA